MKTYIKVPLACVCICFMSFLYAKLTELDSDRESIRGKLAELKPQVVKPAESIEPDDKQKKTIKFKYAEENLIDLINYLAEQKGVNVLVPLSTDEIKTKVTISIDEKMSIDQAWQLLITILDIAGYSLMPKPGGYAIVKTSPQVSRDPVPLYIGVPYDRLPDTDQRIRAMFFLSNIKVPKDLASADQTELGKVIKALMPNGQPDPAKLMFDPVTNAVIITEHANIVRTIMEIVNMLDQTGFKEKIEILPLFHAVASDVKGIFDLIIPKQDMSAYRLDARKPSDSNYFSPFMRIIPNNRLNTLIILGREQAVDRVKEFILKYIDIPQETGKSVLHTYALQYLDAKEFAPLLKSIVESTGTGGTGQSTGINTQGGGIERYFEGVKITHDRPEKEGDAKSAIGGPVKIGEMLSPDPLFYGGNKLIIAARHDDWLRIKKLIEELDTPQPQVILEILVADLSMIDQRLLGSIFRNPMCLPLVKDVQFQSAQVGRVLVNSMGGTGKNDFPPTVTVATSPCGSDRCPNGNCNVDLLKNAVNDSGNYLDANGIPLPEGSLTQSIAVAAGPSAAVLAFSDPDCKVWGMTELKDFLNYNKILSNPHVVAVNNQLTEICIGQIRLVQDSVVGNQAATATISYKSLEANLKIQIKPRVNVILEQDPSQDTVHLGILVEITDFNTENFLYNTAKPVVSSDNPEAANRTKRLFATNANVRSGAIIPLGGLMTRDVALSGNKTPILGNIPILGWFFKQRQDALIDSNLTVFICPTVLRPRLRRGGMDAYTRDYVKLTKQYGQESALFDSLKDPITRWFFKTESDVVDVVTDFLSQDEMKRQPEFHIRTDRGVTRKIGAHTYNAELQEMKKEESEQISTLNIDKDARLKAKIKNINNPLLAAASAA